MAWSMEEGRQAKPPWPLAALLRPIEARVPRGSGLLQCRSCYSAWPWNENYHLEPLQKGQTLQALGSGLTGSKAGSF